MNYTAHRTLIEKMRSQRMTKHLKSATTVGLRVAGLFLGILFLCSIGFSLSGSTDVTHFVPPVQAAEPSPSLPNGREIHPQSAAAQSPTETAPGYCSAAGGSTEFEYISDVTWQEQGSGVFLLTVQVYIANPTGCVYGEACPAYDDSPEYVNAWVDWNGDQQWADSEKVMDKALTGFAGINYRGTMTAIAQVVQPPGLPTSAASTDAAAPEQGGQKWLRTNVGYNHDPDTPCEASWAFGNTVDKPIAAKLPKIKEIQVTNAGNGVGVSLPPLAGYFIKMQAILDLPEGYEVVKVKWDGPDMTYSGEGNPYSDFRPKRGEHGDRTIEATLYYRNTTTNKTGETSLKHVYKLFFEKYAGYRPGMDTAGLEYADDDEDKVPNWFQYWKRDGTIPGMLKPDYKEILYEPTEPDYGAWKDKLLEIHIGKSAGRSHDIRNIAANGPNCPALSLYGGIGIDSLAEIVGHERRHEQIYRNWYVEPLVWTIGQTIDSDDSTPNDKKDSQPGDSLPDDFEATESKTDPNKVDTCNMAGFSRDYGIYGDNEYWAQFGAVNAKGIVEKDFAFPGKQTSPAEVFVTAAALAESKTSDIVTPLSAIEEPGDILAGMAELTGVYSDNGMDGNSDSQFETLRLTVGVNVLTPARYVLIAWLRDGNGVDFMWANHAVNLNAGNQQLDLDFDGTLLNLHGQNGPFTLRRVELRIGERGYVAAFADDAYVTTAYTPANFTPPAVTFSNTFADSPTNNDGDARFDLLNVSVGVQVNAPGNYTLSGWLYDANGNLVPGATADATFTGSGTYTLAFDGKIVHLSRANGPYTLRELEVRNADMERIVYNANAYTTAAYTAEQFQGVSNAATISGAYTDAGQDLNGDGSFDYLRVTLQINVTEAGDYQVEAWLTANGQKTLTNTKNKVPLTAGNNTVTLDFAGGPIRAAGIDGPYQVTGVLVTKLNGDMVDYHKNAHTTQPYPYTNFALPLVALTNGYRDQAADTNGDQVNDYLNVDVGIFGANNGAVVVQGRLVDSLGTQIQSVETTVQVTAGVAQSVTLPFSATLIAASGKNGPYQLHNLLVYHTGDPSQLVTVANAYTTAAYRAQDLTIGVVPQGPSMVYLPAVTGPQTSIPSGCTPAPAGESNTAADAITICSGQSVSGQVSDADLDDVYKISAQAGQQLTVVLQGTGGDADLYLYPPGTDDLFADPYFTRSVTTSNNELLQVTLPVAGYWLVDVYEETGTTDYTVSVTLSAPGQAAQILPQRVDSKSTTSKSTN